MKKNSAARFFVCLMILLSFASGVFAKTEKEDDIFSEQQVEKDDFYNIKIEPRKQDIQNNISKTLESVKQKRLDFQKRTQAEQDRIEASKTNSGDAKDKLRSQLEGKKSKLSSNLGQTDDSKSSSSTASANDKSEQKKSSTTSPKTGSSAKQNAGSSSKSSSKGKTEADFNKAIQQREKFINCCMDLQGTKYVWGGKTPQPGLDCSGLVTWAANKSLNIKLEGNAQNIYEQTFPISMADAVPGDLIFFKPAGSSRISHVGVFLGQNYGKNDFGNQNLFINAASGGPRTGVIISGTNENYWKKTYYSCGRFLDAM